MLNRRIIVPVMALTAVYVAIVLARFKPWQNHQGRGLQNSAVTDDTIAKRHRLTVGFLPVT